MRFVHSITNWLNQPSSYFAYGLIAALTLALMYGVILLIMKIFKVREHWEKHHKHRQ